jgi:hypothetical protein
VYPAQPIETQQSTIHPPYPLTMESFYRWYAEQGCPKIDDDYSYGPQSVSKACEEAEVTLSSESDSDSYYSDCFEIVSARDPTPPNAHRGTATAQSVQSIETCYNTPVGHFHVEQEAHRKIKVQPRRYVNPRRVGKKKPLDPRPRQTPTKVKRYAQPTQLRASDTPRRNEEERRVELNIHKQPLQRRKSRRSRHRRTYPGTDHRQVRKTQPKQPPRTIGTRTLVVPYISTYHIHTKYLLNSPRLAEKKPHCEHKRREWRNNDLIPYITTAPAG